MNELHENKIRGCFYGCALYDALGLANEFFSRAKSSHRVIEWDMRKNGLLNWHKNDRSNFERPEFSEGDWTDDTDQMLLGCRSLHRVALDFPDLLAETTSRETLLEVSIDFAKRLYFWADNGFPELSDCGGMGMGNTTYRVTQHPLYQTHPQLAANAIWIQSGCSVSPNGAVMRCACSGMFGFWQASDKIVERAAAIAIATHADPLAAAAAVTISTTIACLIKSEVLLSDAAIIDVIDLAVEAGKAAGLKYLDACMVTLTDIMQRIDSQVLILLQSGTEQHKKYFSNWNGVKHDMEAKLAEFIQQNRINYYKEELQKAINLERVNEIIYSDKSAIESYIKLSLAEQQIYDGLGPWDDGSMGFSLKALKAGFWALRQVRVCLHEYHTFLLPHAKQPVVLDAKLSNLWKDVIMVILAAGGDVDTNGAVAGSVLGCILGAKSIPQEPGWLPRLGPTQVSEVCVSERRDPSLLEIEVPGKEFLDNEIDLFIQCLNSFYFKEENDTIQQLDKQV